MHRIDGAAHVGNLFSGGTPGVTPATGLTPEWCNDVQENLVDLVLNLPTVGTGAALVKGDYDQIRTQLVATFGRLGAANTWTQTQTFSVAPVVPQSSWNAMTLITPWTALSHTPSYRAEVLDAPRIFLKGTTEALISAAGDVDFWVVPVGYRPPFEIFVMATAYDGSVYKPAVIRYNSGTTSLELHSIDGAAPVTTTTYTVFLDGVNWATD